MRPETWIFLRSAGRAWQAAGYPKDAEGAPATGAAASNMRTEITAARSEGSAWQEIADAALLAVGTVKELAATKEVVA
jgi:hypothetical protein